MSKLRILHITKRYPPYIGGIETVCRDLCAALKDDYEQHVLCFNDAKQTVNEIYEGIDVTRVGVNLTVASQPLCFGYKKELYRLIKEFKPDIIHFDYPNPFAARYLLKAIEKFNYQGKFQLFWHMDIIKQKLIEPFFRKDILKLLDISDQIIITSPQYLENTSYLPNYEKKDKVVILPLRVGEERLVITDEAKRKAEDIRDYNGDRTICFFFGRHVPYKGLKYAIEANNYLDQQKFTFYIGGKGPLTEELKKQARDMSNIKFVGRLSDEEINAYLMACDIFLFPSITRNEAFGISLAEGLWFGKPAVTFTVPGSGINWVSVNDETGIEVENGNARAYAEALTKLATDIELYKRLSKGAYDRAHKYLSKENFNKTVLDIYSKIEK